MEVKHKEKHHCFYCNAFAGAKKYIYAFTKDEIDYSRKFYFCYTNNDCMDKICELKHNQEIIRAKFHLKLEELKITEDLKEQGELKSPDEPAKPKSKRFWFF